MNSTGISNDEHRKQAKRMSKSQICEKRWGGGGGDGVEEGWKGSAVNVAVKGTFQV